MAKNRIYCSYTAPKCSTTWSNLNSIWRWVCHIFSILQAAAAQVLIMTWSDKKVERRLELDPLLIQLSCHGCLGAACPLLKEWDLHDIHRCIETCHVISISCRLVYTNRHDHIWTGWSAYCCLDLTCTVQHNSFAKKCYFRPCPLWMDHF